MATVVSKDSTIIAYDRSGAGPAVVLVSSAFGTRADEAALVAALPPAFTVFAYDRRGRGESSDTAPYAVGREIDDFEAVIDAAGGSAYVFGHSSGAVLALDAAQVLPDKIMKLALYEPPFIVDASRTPMPEDFASHLTQLIAVVRRSDAVEYWQTQLGIPAETIAQMRQSPMWAGLETAAPPPHCAPMPSCAPRSSTVCGPRRSTPCALARRRSCTR